jgi:DNA-binding SARP family transcriptional activator
VTNTPHPPLQTANYQFALPDIHLLKIYLLGPQKFILNGKPVTGFVSQKAPALLAYLAVNAEWPYSRSALAGMFWPESNEQAALKNLRDILSNLRKVLKNNSASPPYLLISRQSVQFNPQSNFRLETAELLTLNEAVRKHQHRNPNTCRCCAENLRQIIELYRGNFLAGFFVTGSPAFDDWQIIRGERLRRIAQDSLFQLTNYHARRQEYQRAKNALKTLHLDFGWVQEMN